MNQNRFEPFLTDFTRWAASQPEIMALIVVGSQARLDRPADIWSDLDLIVYVTRPDRFLQDAGWMEQFGEIWARAVDHTPRGDPEWYIFYEGGRKIDILFVDIHSLSGDRLADWVQHFDFSEVLPRGMRVLLDRTASAGRLPELPVRPSGQPPTQENLDSLVNLFYLSAVRAGRLLHRQDVWRARQAVDEEMKNGLLRMIEWHAISSHAPGYDVWYDGRFLKEWAAPEVLQRLPQCFGGLEMAALWMAFTNTMDLFDDLGRETCANLGLFYPKQVSKHIRNWLPENPV